MEAITRATFYGESLELHCTPNVDEPLLVQLASAFGEVINVAREAKLTCRGHVIIRMELRRYVDLLDLNDYIQTCIRDTAPKIPPTLSPREERRRDLETDEQGRRIKVDGLYVSRQYAYDHFKSYGPIEYCVRSRKSSYIIICYFEGSSKIKALDNELNSIWNADSTVRNKKNERNGKWGPCPLCHRTVNVNRELLNSHTAIYYAETNTPQPEMEINIFNPVQQQTASEEEDLDLEEISDSESCFADSIASEFCAIPHEYRNTTGNMGLFSSHF